MNNALGKHVIAELWVRDPHRLNHPDFIKNALLAACQRGSFTVLDVSTHAFSPHGVTAAVDIFTCGGEPRRALEELKRRLDVGRMDVREMDRGIVGQAPARTTHPSGDRPVDLSRAV